MSVKDPIGTAILEYAKNKKPADIIVSADLCEDDIIPVEVLFRSYDEMPKIEQMALSHSLGRVLDVGAGAGPHSQFLKSKGFRVLSIDTSQGAVTFMQSQGLEAKCMDVMDIKDEKFDTILLLMNGIGIAGTKGKLKDFLVHLKGLLNPGGQILCDSSDVSFLYEEEDGSMWMDLNAEYYGNFKFQLHYKKEISKEFEWLYIDYNSLHEIGNKIGLKCKRLEEDEHHFLAQLVMS